MDAKIHAVAPKALPSMLAIAGLALTFGAAYLLNLDGSLQSLETAQAAFPGWVPAKYSDAAVATAKLSRTLFGTDSAPTVMFYISVFAIAAHVLEALFTVYKIATSGVPVQRPTVYVHYFFAVLAVGYPQTGPALVEIRRAQKAQQDAKKA